jgi:hypothetical protein
MPNDPSLRSDTGLSGLRRVPPFRRQVVRVLWGCRWLLSAYPQRSYLMRRWRTPRKQSSSCTMPESRASRLAEYPVRHKIWDAQHASKAVKSNLSMNSLEVDLGRKEAVLSSGSPGYLRAILKTSADRPKNVLKCGAKERTQYKCSNYK